MNTSKITVLKLRQLKPCGSTTNMLQRLPSIEGFGEHMFQFDVKIPTKLWKSILERRKLVQQRPYYTTQLSLEQASSVDTINARYDPDVVSDLMRDPVQYTIFNAVHITPVNAELFNRFDISIIRGAVIFRAPEIINFNVVLGESFHCRSMEAIYDVSYFPSPLLAERPPGAIISYTIDI